MITEQELLVAIAECQGEKNPNANTCIKLAAYYTILNSMDRGYSHSSSQVSYDSGSEFSDAVQGLNLEQVMPVMDELMEAVMVMIPKLYHATIKRLIEI